jgi:hypothetical protein
MFDYIIQCYCISYRELAMIHSVSHERKVRIELGFIIIHIFS